MGSNQLGLKARGLCLSPLMEYGIPGTQAVDSVIKEIDEQLTENNTRLEECVRELLEMSQSLSGTEQKFYDPVDAVNHLNDKRLLDKDSCYDPDADKVAKLLKHVIKNLDRNPDCAERILQQLLNLCAQDGLCLPSPDAGRDQAGTSVISINTAVDSAQHVNDGLWNDVSLRMRKYFVSRLGQLPVGELPPAISEQREKRIEYVQSLCVFFPTDNVWSLYRSLRTQQLDTCMREMLGSSKKSKDPATFAKTAINFSLISHKVLTMLSEDFELLNSGVFQNVAPPLKALQEIYCDKILDEVSNIVDNLQEELNTGHVSHKKDKKKLREDSRDKDKESMTKSPSDLTFLGQLRGGTKKAGSKSADNLLEQAEEQQFSDIQLLPENVLLPLTQIVDSLLAIEGYLHNLHTATTWEVIGHGVKPKAKSHLKSALKASHNFEEHKAGAFTPTSFEKSGLLPEAIPPPFGATQSMLAELSASLKVVEKPVDDRPRWDWKEAFNKLSPDLAKSVEVHIRQVTDSITQQLDKSLQNKDKFQTAPVCDLVGGRLDYPKVILKGVSDLMSQLDQLLPLARAGQDSRLATVRSAFIDSTAINLKTLIVWLSKLGHAVGDQVPLSVLYVVLSSAAYVRNHLLHYEDTLGLEDHSKKTFPALYRQFCELVDSLTRSVIDHHSRLLSTSLLHDAESHNWNDTKDFYEGERCSFGLQMWNCHLSGLRSDLWATCPPKLAQSIFIAVLQDSLQTLALRYSKVQPSYRRTNQFRVDVTSLLLCTSELLFYASDGANKYLDPSDGHREHNTIHTSCSMLLASMVVVTAPIDILYKTYKKGFKKRRSRTEDDLVRGYPSHWLSWIRPNLFPLGKTIYDDLQTTTSLYMQLKLLASQPHTNWPLLLQALLMKDYTLPILLLTQLAIHSSSHYEEEEAGPTDPSVASAAGTTAAIVSSAEIKLRNTMLEVFESVIYVLLQCTSFPEALARVMVPVFERSDTWSLFDAQGILGKSLTTPPWVDAIMRSLAPFVLRAIDPGVRVLLLRHEEPIAIEPLQLVVKELPCGCESLCRMDDNLGHRVSSSTADLVAQAVQNDPSFTGSKDILAEALYSVVTQLVEDVYAIPAPLIMFFKTAQEQLDIKGIKSPHNCMGIKVLATCLRNALLDVEQIEQLVGRPLSEPVRDGLRMLAECSYHVLATTSYGRGSGTPRLAGMFIKANRSWVTEQAEILAEHFSKGAYDLPEVHPLEGASAEFTENQLMAQASSVLHAKTGEKSLMKIQNFALQNLDWIAAQMDISPLLASKSSPRIRTFKVTTEPMAPEPFNPLRACRRIGKTYFDHMRIADFPYDWQALLHSDLGISEVTFRYLLSHRHELQEGAVLEDTEKKPVEALKKKFLTDNGDL